MSFSKKTVPLAIAGYVLPRVISQVSKVGLSKGYKLAFGEEPPLNPASRQVSWGKAITWAVAGGVVGGLTSLVARRLLDATPIPVEGEDNVIESAIETIEID